MIRAKAVDPRTGRPSWNQLAIIAGVGTTTLTDAIRGAKKTSAGTVTKLATALRVSPAQVSEWLNLARQVGDPYQWPAEADLLTPRQRKALTNLIRSIVADEQEGGEGHEHGPAPMKDELSMRRGNKYVEAALTEAESARTDEEDQE